jgi:hypothetical protein
MRSLVSWLPVVILSCVLAAASAASAQSHAPALDPELTLTLHADARTRELASIDSEARAATALYVTAVTLHLGGIATMFASAIANFCIPLSGTCDDAHERALPGEIMGGVFAGLGLVGLFVAIGLDVGSGRRRHALGTSGEVALSIAPSTDGASLTLRGSF